MDPPIGKISIEPTYVIVQWMIADSDVRHGKSCVLIDDFAPARPVSGRKFWYIPRTYSTLLDRVFAISTNQNTVIGIILQ